MLQVGCLAMWGGVVVVGAFLVLCRPPGTGMQQVQLIGQQLLTSCDAQVPHKVCCMAMLYTWWLGCALANAMSLTQCGSASLLRAMALASAAVKSAVKSAGACHACMHAGVCVGGQCKQALAAGL
ncbi:hypothetical protein COO60DRAFT_804260 [Scenedesmus sp. NREL 46B-D3]|nr:hypothetical protein COO60DRAFT_804260 [Scenedesmus sp. NREL 46B-D3]